MLRSRLLIAVLACALALPAQAAIQQVQVLAVGVDRNANKARAMALDYAKKRAVYLVAQKMPVDQAGAKVAAFTAEDFRTIVRGAEITQLRRQGERTIADVQVTIVDTALKRALGMQDGEIRNVSDEFASMRGVLVLPVLVRGERPYLWEKENSLRVPLRSAVLRQGHGAVLVPAGDLDDLRLVDYQNVLSVTPAELAPMFTRYGADEIVIAVLTVDGAASSSPILLRRLSKDGVRVETLPADNVMERASDEARVGAAAEVIAGAVVQIASATAELEQKRLAAAHPIPLVFKYARPRELAQMQETLRAQPQVLQLAIPAITTGTIRGVAYVDGAPEKLREKLRKTGIIITDAGDGWQLSLR